MTHIFEVRIIGYTAKEAKEQLDTIAGSFNDSLTPEEARFSHPENDHKYVVDPSKNVYAGHFKLAAGKEMPEAQDILRVLDVGDSAPHAVVDIGEQGNVTIKRNRVESTKRYFASAPRAA